MQSYLLFVVCGRGSVGEHRLAKARVASSNLVSRSIKDWSYQSFFKLLQISVPYGAGIGD